MIIRITIGVLLSAALTASVHAQSFDGTYTGTRTLTKITRTGQGTPNCPPVGRKTPVVFTVANSTITAFSREENIRSSGSLASDGSFTITYGAGFWGGGPGSGTIPVTWSGRIRGSRIQANFIVRGPAGDCIGTFSARK
jgi:hypothetical protein